MDLSFHRIPQSEAVMSARGEVSQKSNLINGQDLSGLRKIAL